MASFFRKGYDDCFQSSLLLLGNKTPITVQRRELCKLFPVVVSSLVRSSAQHRISHVEEDGSLSNIVKFRGSPPFTKVLSSVSGVWDSCI